MQHFCYLRASVFKPNDPNKISISMQLSLIQEAYPDVNLQVFQDKNVSGTLRERPGLNQLIEATKKVNTGGVIYIYKWDRLARNLLLMLDLFDSFTKKNFTIVSITDDVPTNMKKSPAMTRLYLQTLWAFSETKVAMIKENQRIALAYKRNQGLPLSSKVPYGYTWENGMAVVKDCEAEIVNQIFEWYVNHGIGYGEIAAKLSREDCTMNNKAFRKHNVKDILTNSFYVGMLKGGQFEPYEGNHKPIVSKKIFEEAQAIRIGKQKDRNEQKGFKLRQKISCPECQTTLTPNQQRQLNKIYRYYVCPTCKKVSVSATEIEEESCQLVKQYLLESSHFKQLLKSLQDQHNEVIKNNAKKITNIKSEKDKLMTLFEEGKINQENLICRLKALDDIQTERTVYIDQEKLEHTLQRLIQLQKSPIDDVLFQQIEKIVLTTNKKIKEIYLNGIPISII
ncbi:recombinase family protein [uncultured Vagococcus sp.]|uniref:recombinase family protein n=1 Tax=uncultured Vagococcus sp. TaxID=189676 RepID=UPI00258E560B|nr:recombinase family protein [uncultured Vagococcus sp.]